MANQPITPTQKNHIIKRLRGMYSQLQRRVADQQQKTRADRLKKAAAKITDKALAAKFLSCIGDETKGNYVNTSSRERAIESLYTDKELEEITKITLSTRHSSDIVTEAIDSTIDELVLNGNLRTMDEIIARLEAKLR